MPITENYVENCTCDDCRAVRERIAAEPAPGVADWVIEGRPNRPYIQDLGDGLHLTRTMAGESGSPQAFASAFDFLQRHAQGRYSDRTLMSVSRWSFTSAEMVEGRRQSPDRIAASVHSIGKEVTYDEETEVKHGGTVAMAVCLPSEYGAKVVIATAPDCRRQGYGRRILQRIQSTVPYAHAWVGNTNIAGMQFLLDAGMRPLSMNRRQAVLFGLEDMPDEEGVAL